MSAEDKTGAVIVKLGELAKEVLKAAAAVPGPRAVAGPFKYTFVIDLTDPNELSKVNTALKNVNCSLELAIVEPPQPSPQPSPQKNGPGSRQGVLFRPSLPYVLEIKNLGTPSETKVQQTIYLPRVIAS